MIDPTPNEHAAMEAGGRCGGGYLDSIGKTDLALLSSDEWRAFIEAIVTAYCDHLREMALRDRQHLNSITEAVPFP